MKNCDLKSNTLPYTPRRLHIRGSQSPDLSTQSVRSTKSKKHNRQVDLVLLLVMALHYHTMRSSLKSLINRSSRNLFSGECAAKNKNVLGIAQVQQKNSFSSQPANYKSNTVMRTSKGGFRHPTHAVSLDYGDYTDYEDESTDDYFSMTPNLSRDRGTQGWAADPNHKIDAEKDYNITQAQLEVFKEERMTEEQRRRWIEKSKPPFRVSEIDEHGRAKGKGGRKTATAHVHIYPGQGFITVNNKDFVDYFPRDTHRADILQPFIATQTCGMFDVSCQVIGGGSSGQAGAVRHGIARALEKYNPDYRPPMKALGLMTRDSRMVERKKVGLKKARKAPQWVKR